MNAVQSLRASRLVNVAATASSLYISGTMQLNVSNGASAPLDHVTGMVAVSTVALCGGGTTHPSGSVALASPPDSPASQRYFLTGGCFQPVDAEGVAPSLPAPSARMCARMLGGGGGRGAFATCDACNLAFSGAFELSLSTGGGDEYVQAVGVSEHSSLDFRLSGGDDTLVLALFLGTDTNATADLGHGNNDNLTLLLPVGGQVAASFGAEPSHSDVFETWWGSMQPPPEFTTLGRGGGASGGGDQSTAVVRPLRQNGGPASQAVLQQLTSRDQPILKPG